MNKAGRPPKSVEYRFWRNVSILTENECWEWTAGKSEDGYGKIIALGEQMAHRVSWILNKGPIPEGIKVLHKCDNPPCVNPNHLFLGTIGENNHDRHLKGRTVVPNKKGSKHGMAKLTEDDVLEILKLSKQGISNREIARMYNSKVSKATVYGVISRKVWAHVHI